MVIQVAHDPIDARRGPRARSRRNVLLGLAALPLLGLGAIQERAAGLPKGEPEALGFDAEAIGRIEQRLEEAVDGGKVAGASALIARRGEVAALFVAGDADREAGRPMAADTIVRIASMSKPITTVAALILVDEGAIDLDDPVSKFLPEFAHPTVLVPGSPEDDGGAPYEIVPAEGEITIRQLLTHTSGLTYRFAGRPHLAEQYARAGISDGLIETPGTIADNAWRIAQVPLHHHPGTAWEYSLATDVLGRVVEVASGMTLDDAFRSRIFEPLGMVDTHFVLPPEKRDRLAAVYEPDGSGGLQRFDNRPEQHGPLVYSDSYPTWDDGTYDSGGAGLVSTLGDYARFLQMLVGRGELDGVRLLRPETVDAMTRDQTAGLDVPDWGHGDAFGFGVGVVTPQGEVDGGPSAGSFSWGGFFSTYFWADPRDDLVGVLFTQAYPGGDPSLREDFRRLTYEAIDR